MNRCFRAGVRRWAFLIGFWIIVQPPAGLAAVRLDSLGKYLTKKGYGGAQLVHSGKFYHLPIRSNGRAGHLVIDTGTHGTLIFRSSVRQLKLTETRTNIPVRSILGLSNERYGRSIIHSFQAGNFTVKQVPVAIAPDLGDSNTYGRPNGLLGLRELMKFGAVLDCSRRILYLRPARPERDVTGQIRSILESRGWKPIALTYTRNRLRVPGETNDVPCHFFVDTGTFLITLDRSWTNRARIPTREIDSTVHGVGRSSRRVQLASLDTVWIGNYQVRGALAAVLSMDAPMLFRGTPSEVVGLVGVDYLARNSAIFDFVSGTLYLKPRTRH
ncbi:MAG TPA: pepsin/retropepsin-like aspartic protease family protein [Chthoniobacterales bacterium]|nr:pepsin/retropepsin-like aspartic protease family protein [Chthoniobacterales bacterium]